jgi:hypothetical protein
VYLRRSSQVKSFGGFGPMRILVETGTEKGTDIFLSLGENKLCESLWLCV